jgi:putative methyltransferase (TIGR04325 family)
MNSSITQWIPPIFIRFFRKVGSRSINFDGWYTEWNDANAQCSGYDQESIVNQALNASLLVSQGKAIFERDSVIFDDIQYSWPLLSGLMLAAALEDGQLKVIDFGGALGTSYFQNLRFLEQLKNIEWSIIEQKHFVALGRQHLLNETLKFYNSIQDLSAERQANVVLLSSVMQYLPEPYEILNELLLKNPKVVIFDRTSFINSGDEDRIRIQNVPEEIYKASYPCWFLSKPKLCNYLNERGYKVLESFDSNECLDKFATWGGMILIRVTNG